MGPLKTILFHYPHGIPGHYFLQPIDGNQILTFFEDFIGVCFSQSKRNFKLLMDQKQFNASDPMDDSKPYTGNLVKWSSSKQMLYPKTHCETIGKTWLEDNEFFAYAEVTF